MAKINLLAKGWLYNDESNKLESYELVRIFVDFDKNIIRYICNVGGQKDVTISGTSLLELYASEEDFRRGKRAVAGEFSAQEVASRICGHQIAEGGRVYYPHKGGVATAHVAECCYVYEDPRWRVAGDVEIFHSQEALLRVHDYTVRNEDGTEVVRKSLKSKVALTEEQMDIARQISDLLHKAAGVNMQLIFDDATQTCYAVNMEYVDIYNSGCSSVLDLCAKFPIGTTWCTNAPDDIQVALKDE